MDRDNLILLHFFICIPFRALTIYLLQSSHPSLARPILLTSLLFLTYRWIVHTPKEIGLFGGTVWWQDSRLIHMFLIPIALQGQINILYIGLLWGVCARSFSEKFQVNEVSMK